MVIIKVVLDGLHLANVSFSQNWNLLLSICPYDKLDKYRLV